MGRDLPRRAEDLGVITRSPAAGLKCDQRSYAFLSVFGSESPVRGRLLASASKETLQMYASIREQLIAEGKARRLAKREAKGATRSMAPMSERLIDTCGLSLTDERRELAGCRDEILPQRWFDRAVTATSITGIFD